MQSGKQTRSAHAKLNLTLDVLGKRGDGYHEIESFIAPITLHDDVYLSLEGEGLSILCSDASVPCDETNLAARALREFQRVAGRDFPAQIRIDKRIPPGSGMGGGSSDAAAVLAMLNEAHDGLLNEAELAGVGAAVGSDVPFFLAGDAAIARGRGEKLTTVELRDSLAVLIAWPGISVSTEEIYSALSAAALTSTEPAPRRGLAGVFAAECGIYGLRLAARHMSNDLQAPATSLHQEIADLLRVLHQTNPICAQMTGSGSACFALYASGAEAGRAREHLPPGMWSHLDVIGPKESQVGEVR